MARRPARSALLRRARRATTVSAVGVIAAIALSSCVGSTPEPDPSVDATTTPQTSASANASPTAAPSPTPQPTLLPEGTAAENLPVFTAVTLDVWESDDRSYGRAYVDALAAAGFDRGAMQVTQDVSTVGNQAESMQFSVLWDGECLIGQVGPATGDPVTVVVAPTEEGTCLIGKTRPIDW